MKPIDDNSQTPATTPTQSRQGDTTLEEAKEEDAAGLLAPGPAPAQEQNETSETGPNPEKSGWFVGSVKSVAAAPAKLWGAIKSWWSGA
jgi:hypothetical protein